MEGELEVEAGVVVLDGGHHRDLEEEHQQEQAQEDVALEQDAGEQRVVQSLQLQILAEDEEAVQHEADRQVGVQDVQQPRLDVEVLTIFRGNFQIIHLLITDSCFHT